MKQYYCAAQARKDANGFHLDDKTAEVLAEIRRVAVRHGKRHLFAPDLDKYVKKDLTLLGYDYNGTFIYW